MVSASRRRWASLKELMSGGGGSLGHFKMFLKEFVCGVGGGVKERA